MMDINNEPDNVQFDEETNGNEFHIRSRELLGRSRMPASVRYLIDNGFVKSEAQAVGLILGTASLFVILSGWIISASLTHPANLFVTDQYGREIPFEVYVENIRNGDDPLQYK